MRKIILALLLCFAGGTISQSTAVIMCAAEFRQILPRGDGSKESLLSETLMYHDPGSIIAVAGHSYSITRAVHDYTWNIHAQKAGPCCSVTAGHYRIRHATGLLMGNNKYRTPARHPASSLSARQGETFLPSDGRFSPRSYNGLAGSILAVKDPLTMTISPLFSCKVRYGHALSHYQGYSHASYHLIDARSKKNYPHVEPLVPIDYGVVLSLSYRHLMTFSISIINSLILKPSGRSIGWSARGRYPIASFDTGYRGIGLYMNYDDGCLRIYTEWCASMRKVKRARTKGEIIDWGIASGIGFQSLRYSCSIHAEYTGKSFYAPHSARYPYSHLNVNMTGRSIIGRRMYAGWLFGTARRYNRQNNRENVPHTINEKVSLGMRFRKKDGLHLNAMGTHDSQRKRTVMRASARANLNGPGTVEWSLTVSCRNSYETNKAWKAALTIGNTFRNGQRLALSFRFNEAYTRRNIPPGGYDAAGNHRLKVYKKVREFSLHTLLRLTNIETSANITLRPPIHASKGIAFGSSVSIRL